MLTGRFTADVAPRRSRWQSQWLIFDNSVTLVVRGSCLRDLRVMRVVATLRMSKRRPHEANGLHECPTLRKQKQADKARKGAWSTLGRTRLASHLFVRVFCVCIECAHVCAQHVVPLRVDRGAVGWQSTSL